MATDPKCWLCELPVASDEQQSGCADGVHYHRICFSIGVADLESDLTAHAEAEGWPKVEKDGKTYYAIPDGGLMET